MAQQQQDRQVQLAERQQQESPNPMPDPQDLEVEQHPREDDRNPFWPPWPPNFVCMTVFLTACVGIFFRIAEWVYFFVFKHKDD